MTPVPPIVIVTPPVKTPVIVTPVPPSPQSPIIIENSHTDGQDRTTDDGRRKVKFNDDIKEEIFVFNEGKRVEMVIDQVEVEKEETERTKKKDIDSEPNRKEKYDTHRGKI